MFANTVSLYRTCSFAKRAKTVNHQIPYVKNCIICIEKKCQGDSRKLCICKTRKAKQLFSGIKSNKDEVFTRCDIFAADVMHHKNCMTNYIVKFQRDVSEILNDNNDQCDNRIIREVFLETVVTLELDKERYTVSDRRDTLNSNLSKAEVGKRSLFYLIFVLKIICLCKSYFFTRKTIKKGFILSFNATCVSNIDLYYVAKC